MRVNYYRPHPREYWDDEMKPDSEKDYRQAMETERRLRKELGL